MTMNSNKSLDEIDISFTQKLQDIPQNKQLKFTIRSEHSALIFKLFPAQSKSAIARRIQQTCNFTDKQMRLLSQIKYISFDSKSRPFINKKKGEIIPQNKAIFFLLIICILSILILYNIIFLPIYLPALMLYSLGLGLAVGGVVGLILDRSFRMFPVIHKLEALKPWLAEA
ncbi:hypothetical protein Mmol_1472 [Methylotenera mobilis JLW8]|uniref:Uncharacterized protein n=2 Tax=Methylotenera mobilis TaxID=359408 RepID=C6WWS7_METML|nr:hypothetical protein Mmol_1472 [Methylotenera mobilis JLW8]